MSKVNEKFELLSEKFANAIKELAEAKRDVDECITLQSGENSQKLCCHESEDHRAELNKLRYDNAELIKKEKDDKVMMIKACNNFDELQRRHDKVLQNYHAHKTMNQALKNTIDQLQLRYKEKLDEFRSFENERSKWRHEVEELENQLQVAEDRCLRLEVNQNALTVKHEQALAAKEAQITELQNSLDNLKIKSENDLRAIVEEATRIYENIINL
uniref:TACC_C domain-containing protein n=1 Tax=Panagrellus redivivus TaxID=6233 RepID=A0A7E4W4G6_PANRE